MEEMDDHDLNELLQLGTSLRSRSQALGGRTTGTFLSETLLRIRDRHGKSMPLVPNRVQREYERRRGRRNIVLKARQMGISTWVAGQLFLKTITKPGSMTVQVAHTQDSAEAIFRIVHRFWLALPEELRVGSLRTSRASVRQMVFPVLDSEYRVESAGDRNAGRGITIQNLHCSEVARWPGDPGETLGGLMAAMPRDGELVLESTPNGSAGCFFEEWTRAAEVGMVRHFFPWWWEATYVEKAVAEGSLTEEERSLMERHGLSREQIGYRRTIKERFGELSAQEFAEDADTCFLSSGSCVFDVKALDDRMNELPEPTGVRLGGGLQIWYPPIQGREYLVAVDPAGGGSEGDFSCAQVLDLQTGLQCAELQGKLGTLELAQQATTLAKEYNEAMLAVERNNHGSGVLAYLHGVCHYRHIYQQGGQDGWLTSSLTRPEMIGGLASALVEQPEIFQSRRLLRECRGFVRLHNGRIEAQAGTHDDCVMAMAIGLSVRKDLAESRGRRST